MPDLQTVQDGSVFPTAGKRPLLIIILAAVILLNTAVIVLWFQYYRPESSPDISLENEKQDTNREITSLQDRDQNKGGVTKQTSLPGATEKGGRESYMTQKSLAEPGGEWEYMPEAQEEIMLEGMEAESVPSMENIGGAAAVVSDPEGLIDEFAVEESHPGKSTA